VHQLLPGGAARGDADGEALGAPVPLYAELLEKGRKELESGLWNGEYFVQKVEWKNLRAKNPLETKSMVGTYSPEATLLFEKKGRSTSTAMAASRTAVLGAWLAACQRRLGLPRRREAALAPRGRPPPQLQARPARSTRTRTAHLRLRRRERPAALHLAARRTRPRCRSSTRTRCGPASSTRWRRT
jgi:hypothetical protein